MTSFKICGIPVEPKQTSESAFPLLSSFSSEGSTVRALSALAPIKLSYLRESSEECPAPITTPTFVIARFYSKSSAGCEQSFSRQKDGKF